MTDSSILNFSPDASLHELLDYAQSKYQTRFEPLKIGENKLELLQFEDMEKYIEQLDAQTGSNDKIELPFWAKIWPTSILLSYYLRNLNISLDTHLLEIGAGIGICGLFAAKLGYKVTISDINEDALLFARINILKNNLQDKAQIKKIDFTKDKKDENYKIIIGSETLYKEDTYRPLIKFFLNNLKPNQYSEVILANHYKIKAKKFFKLAQQEFDIEEKTIGFKESSDNSADNNSDSEKHLCKIYRMRPLKYVKTE